MELVSYKVNAGSSKRLHHAILDVSLSSSSNWSTHSDPSDDSHVAFRFYIMVDWSGAARRRGMRADAIWIAYGDIKAEKPKTLSPFSRTEATQLVDSLLDDQANNGLRVLACFDFAYGYPRDFPAALQAATGKADSTLPWLTVWRYLSDAIGTMKVPFLTGSLQSQQWFSCRK